MNPSTEFSAFQAEVRAAVEDFLCSSLRSQPDSLVGSAAEYVLLGGGHRWRAIMAAASGRIFHADALRLTLPGASGIELTHAASLVLDDLPSMDDVRIRRGKACVHLKFPRWTVDLLPVYLVNLAYRVSLDNPLASHERRVVAAVELGRTRSCRGHDDRGAGGGSFPETV